MRPTACTRRIRFASFSTFSSGCQPNAVPEVRNVARKKAEGALAQLKRGADFGALASKLSEDPGSKAEQGFLPAESQGQVRDRLRQRRAGRSRRAR